MAKYYLKLESIGSFDEEEDNDVLLEKILAWFFKQFSLKLPKDSSQFIEAIQAQPIEAGTHPDLLDYLQEDRLSDQKEKLPRVNEKAIKDLLVIIDMSPLFSPLLRSLINTEIDIVRSISDGSFPSDKVQKVIELNQVSNGKFSIFGNYVMSDYQTVMVAAKAGLYRRHFQGIDYAKPILEKIDQFDDTFRLNAAVVCAICYYLHSGIIFPRGSHSQGRPQGNISLEQTYEFIRMFVRDVVVVISEVDTKVSKKFIKRQLTENLSQKVQNYKHYLPNILRESLPSS